MWPLIGKVALIFINWISSRSDRKEKAEEQFMRIVRRMDELAAQNAKLKIKYDQLRKSLGETQPKDPGI